MEDKSFITKVITAFSHVQKEMEKASLEHDMRPRFVKYFVELVLGYSGSDYRYEKKRTDITIFDENKFAIIKIETKKPSMSIEKPEYEEQAFKYEEETTKYIGLTNFVQFKLWEISKTTKELKINLDFSNILERRDQLSTDEKVQILFFTHLTKEILFDSRKYEQFDETYKRIDITKDAGFKKLLDRLNFIVNDLMMGYTLKAFGEYKEGYNKYLTELQKVDTEVKNNRGNRELNHNLIRYRQQVDEKYKKYLSFSGFGLWKQFSGKENVPDDKVKEVFCKETIYVLLNKLLFIRICEDKELLPKNISNGGIEDLRKHFTGTEDAYKEILHVAYRNAKKFYTHFYEPGILDWYMEGDSELNEILNKVLWILNQFDFTHVDRDILGNLYEKYLPGDERKRLGEFYTPVEVIDYILTSVGYTYSYDVESKDLLDPACGSGGFIVRATRRLISRYLIKFNKAEKKELRDPRNWQEIVNRLSPSEAKIILEAIQEHIYGLDINPFACHIAEMNMLFQVIDLYKKAREHYKDYKLGKFKIYRTDSLEIAKDQRQIFDFTHKEFLEEQEEINVIKRKKFDFVVGNPPYVQIKGIDEHQREIYKNSFKTAFGRFDLYTLFMEQGIKWLKINGKLGYITSNKFIWSDAGKKIRNFVSENKDIQQLIDFGDTGVFKDATNYPCIFILSKLKNLDDIFKVIKVKKSKQDILNHIWEHFKDSYYNDEWIQLFDCERKMVKGEKWQMYPREIIRLCQSIEKITNTTLGELCIIREASASGADKVFIVDDETIKKSRLEKNLIFKFIKGEDVRKWRIIWEKIFAIYPYTKERDKINLENLSDFPNIKTYLSRYENELKDRYCVKKGGKEWYEWHDPASNTVFEKEKIITPDISDRNNFAYDEEGCCFKNTCYVIIPKPDYKSFKKYILGLLNSNLLEFYFKQISPFVSGGYYRYKTQYLAQIPIKLPKTNMEKHLTDKIVEKVSKILELNKSSVLEITDILVGEDTEKLGKKPKVSFSIRDDATFEKIETERNRLYINNTDFIEINDKKIMDFARVYFNFYRDNLSKSKDVKTMILNIPVPKSDEIIKEIIRKGNIDYKKTKDKIQNWEQEINNLVYELYDLSKKEIAIVKKSLID